MTVDLCMAHMLILASLTLISGHSGSAKQIIGGELSRQIAISIELVTTVGHFVRDFDFGNVYMACSSCFRFLPSPPTHPHPHPPPPHCNPTPTPFPLKNDNSHYCVWLSTGRRTIPLKHTPPSKNRTRTQNKIKQSKTSRLPPLTPPHPPPPIPTARPASQIFSSTTQKILMPSPRVKEQHRTDSSSWRRGEKIWRRTVSETRRLLPPSRKIEIWEAGACDTLKCQESPKGGQ